MDEAWSPPDGEGISTLTVPVGATSTLRGRRRRRGAGSHPEAVSTWPAEWRELAARWLKGGERRRWTTLIRLAGSHHTSLAQHLLDALLHAGLVEVEESRHHATWEVRWVRFTGGGALREALGLPDRAAEAAAWEAAAATPLTDSRLAIARTSLDRLPPATALRRLALLRALERWSAEERFGTRRDFALFARGHTKGITAGEWQWLAATCDLARLAVADHTPAIRLAAPLTLRTESGRLELAATGEWLGLTPATVAATVATEGTIESWRLVENRTSFERVARRHGGRAAVVWLPGYPAPWWCEAIAHLLHLAPAPAWIACDPDPAGIQICLHAARLWEAAGLAWRPWHMDEASLDRLPVRLPLTEGDQRLLDRLAEQPLPAELAALAAAMRERGEKGEQEGIV